MRRRQHDGYTHAQLTDSRSVASRSNDRGFSVCLHRRTVYGTLNTPSAGDGRHLLLIEPAVAQRTRVDVPASRPAQRRTYDRRQRRPGGPVPHLPPAQCALAVEIQPAFRCARGDDERMRAEGEARSGAQRKRPAARVDRGDRVHQHGRAEALCLTAQLRQLRTAQRR